MFIGNNPKCLLTGEWINKWWCICKWNAAQDSGKEGTTGACNSMDESQNHDAE